MTREVFQEQMRKLNGELIMMGDLCEEAMSLVMKALREMDVTLVEHVHKIEREINQKEREIEGLCMKLLLRQQPVAKDLREISAALRMITDMERIGDQTTDIADIIRYLTTCQVEVPLTLFSMGKITAQMVNDSVNAFVRRNEKLAHAVIEKDDEIDQKFVEMKAELMKRIREKKESDGNELDLLMIAKYLERIGDHAVNLGEWVVYSITTVHP